MTNHVFYGLALPEGAGPWAWKISPPDLVEVVSFASRLDAQGWLGDNVDKLRTAGVHQVQLTHDDDTVGQMIAIGQTHE